jgi:hypothetical protein
MKRTIWMIYLRMKTIISFSYDGRGLIASCVYASASSSGVSLQRFPWSPLLPSLVIDVNGL